MARTPEEVPVRGYGGAARRVHGVGPLSIVTGAATQTFVASRCLHVGAKRENHHDEGQRSNGSRTLQAALVCVTLQAHGNDFPQQGPEICRAGN